MSNFEDAALGYVNDGLCVIALKPESKVPATKHGLKDCTDNPTDVEKLWGINPRFNVGVVCGHRDFQDVDWGLGVIDVDVHGVDGREWMREWQISHGELPETWTVRTGSGGLQYYFRFTGDVPPNSANGKIGVDFRGQGGYVVAPPSIHPDTGDAYEWSVSPEDCDIAFADETVMQLIQAIKSAASSEPKGGGEERAQKARFTLPDVVREGEGRNDCMFRYARSLLSDGLSEERVKEIVRDANRSHCIPPIKKAELEKTLSSACSKEPGNEWRKGKDPALEGLPDFYKRSQKGRIIGVNVNKLAQAVMIKYLAKRIDGTPAIWTGRRYDFNKRAISNAVLELYPDASKRERNEVYDYIADQAPYVSSDVEFDNGWYVQFENCTIDVMTMQEVEPKPTMRIYVTIPHVMDLEKAKEPNYFDEFMRSISGGDAATNLSLCEVIGSGMTSRIAAPQAVFLVGRARGGGKGRASNGKSTFISLDRAVVGSRNAASLDITTFNQNDYAAGSLIGKSANLGDDISSEFLTQRALALFKKLTSGEVLSTDQKYSDRVEFAPFAQHVYSMNEVPRFDSVTEGELRRIHFIGFKQSFYPGDPGYDPDIKSKLLKPECLVRAAYVGLVSIKGVILRGHFTEIPSMQADMTNIRLNSSIVLRWLSDKAVDPLAIDGMPFNDVFQMHLDWCDEVRERNPIKKNKLVEQMNTCGWFSGTFETRRMTKGIYGVKKRVVCLVYTPPDDD